VIESESAAVTVRAETGKPGFVHSALIYHSQEEYLDFVVRFVLDGSAMEEAVLVALPGDKLSLLHDAVHGAGAALPDLDMVDITEATRAGLWPWRVPSPPNTPIGGCGL
jgi:DcmR-like sensory protein